MTDDDIGLQALDLLAEILREEIFEAAEARFDQVTPSDLPLLFALKQRVEALVAERDRRGQILISGRDDS